MQQTERSRSELRPIVTVSHGLMTADAAGQLLEKPMRMTAVEGQWREGMLRAQMGGMPPEVQLYLWGEEAQGGG
jgi:hypothetical protein